MNLKFYFRNKTSMTIADEIMKVVNKRLNLCVSKIAEKYEIPENDLKELVELTLNGKIEKHTTSSKKETKEEKKEEKEEVDLTIEMVVNANVATLKKYCKAKGLKCGGKKAELVERLTEFIERDPSLFSQVNERKSQNQNQIRIETKLKKPKKSKVVENIKNQVNVFQIRKNEFDNHEHAETRLVFREGNVVGTQNDDGTVSELTTDDIDTCNKYKFPYVIGENLDEKEEVEDVDVDEEESIVAELIDDGNDDEDEYYDDDEDE